MTRAKRELVILGVAVLTSVLLAAIAVRLVYVARHEERLLITSTRPTAAAELLFIATLSVDPHDPKVEEKALKRIYELWEKTKSVHSEQEIITSPGGYKRLHPDIHELLYAVQSAQRFGIDPNRAFTTVVGRKAFNEYVDRMTTTDRELKQQ